MDIDWVKTTSICTLVVTCSKQHCQSPFEVNVSSQGQKRPDERETTAPQNIITEVIYSVYFGIANIISTLLIF